MRSSAFLASSFLGLPPYRDSITQLMVHSLYQSLLLHRHQRNSNGATSSVEMEIRLGELKPKVRKRHDDLTHSISRRHASMLNSSDTLLTYPVSTPCIIHHKARYQSRFDVGVTFSALQRLEYLLRIPHRHPPQQLLTRETPLSRVRTHLLPTIFCVYGKNLSRFNFVLANNRNQRILRFHSALKKHHSTQSDIICPNWASDMRLSVAVEHIINPKSSQPTAACYELPSASWSKDFSFLVSQSQRSRTLLGRYLWLDIAVVHDLSTQMHSLKESAKVPLTERLQSLFEAPESSKPLDVFPELSIPLTIRKPIRKVELEINVPAVYNDWKAFSRCYLHEERCKNTTSFKRKTSHSAKLKPISLASYSAMIKEVLQPNDMELHKYPSLFGVNIHQELSSNKKGDKQLLFLYGVAQEILTVMQFLALNAEQ